MAKLFTDAANAQTLKVQAVASFAGYKLDVVELNDEDLAAADFLAKSPLGKAPVLETAQGFLNEPNAIARFIAKARPEAGLNGDFAGAAQIEQWLDFALAEIEPAANVWTWPLLGKMKADKRGAELAKVQILKALAVLNSFLESQTFLAGQRITLADVVVAASLLNVYKLALDPASREQTPHVTRWFTTIVNQPAFKAVAGEVALCNVAAAAAPAKAEKPKAAEKPKEAPKPKEEKKAKKDDEEELEEAPKKKELSADEIWAQKPSAMELDATKKLLCNNPINVALPQMWEKFDAANWKLFVAKFKYAEENNSWVMTRNLIGGYLQRLPTLRKVGFGCIAMAGHLSDPDADGPGPFDIYIAWASKTPGVPQALLECDDTECYVLTEVDVNNAEQKALWSSIWAEANVEGKPVQHREKYV